MIADLAVDSVAFYAIVLGAVVLGILKGAERFGWLRSPTAWRTEAEALGREAERLNNRISALEREVVDLRNENSTLKSRPDFTALASLVEKHDQREAENHQGTLAALEAIAHRLEALATTQ